MSTMAVIITLLILGHSASTTIKFSTVHHHTQSTISDLLRQTMATCCCPSLRSHYAHSLRFGHCPHGPFRLKISLHYLQLRTQLLVGRKVHPGIVVPLEMRQHSKVHARLYVSIQKQQHQLEIVQARWLLKRFARRVN